MTDKRNFIVFNVLVLLSYVVVTSFGIFILEITQKPKEVEEIFEPKTYLYEHCKFPDCDPLLLETIAFCESGWKMVKNSGSTASGYFQILDSTEKTTPQYKEGERKTDPSTNIDMGIFLFESRGWQPWYPSRHCWSPKYSYQVSNIPDQCIGDCK